MRSVLIAGNWKMHGDNSQNADFVHAFLPKITDAKVDIAICPPTVYLATMQQHLADSAVALGAQNCATETQGAYTGECAVSMLRDTGCEYVIVGHSERRALYGETNTIVATKFAQCKTEGLRPILCVGETLDERRDGALFDVIEAQVNAVFDALGADAFNDSVIAYEPVWAIGTGETATPAQAQEVHQFIRQVVAKQSAESAAALQILYGGSMKPGNAAELLSQADIDGGLVGGASLNADDFAAICHAVG